ncbi:hypothetical protein E1H12_09710 [Geitlerinema sp. P-1104]|uniref:hypothetical protein n=1 Tax=Geitlerinema sp. P-1104 TaxID=2546230 RepID=UPI0014778536|nr:hypothetical protein [Geitlerinema sp. P-1104]NMG58793.1 hypothetical protein [Geitlerinema sp. P-1104]
MVVSLATTYSILVMPGINGFELIQRLRKIPEFARLPIISGAGDSLDVAPSVAIAYSLRARF